MVVLAVNAPALVELTATVCGGSAVEVGPCVEKLSCAGIKVMAPVAPIVRVTVTVWLLGVCPVEAKVMAPP